MNENGCKARVKLNKRMIDNNNEIADVVIIGAGISGIGTAYWLQKKCPTKKYTILEARESIGGTWSLFRYPGIRSDSDMFTFGYKFKPWKNPNLLSSGESILSYLAETVKENNIEKNIQFKCKLIEAHWSDISKIWTLSVQKNNSIVEIKCKFLSICSGYYSYSEAYKPDFIGEGNFKGQTIIPQFWPENFDFKNKKIIVVGSGATAVTLVPAMAEQGAAHVTMLQRSPSYIFTIPNKNVLFNFLRKYLPTKLSHTLIRALILSLSVIFYSLSRKFPKKIKSHLIKNVAKQLPSGYDVEKHFTPKYNPWDQRVCAVPDGDFFEAIKSGKASVVTDEITQFTENGILLKSGEEIKADIIVLATGLKMNLMGYAKIFVNEKQLNLNEHLIYKGMMISNVPNHVCAFGYTNASWTLKVDLTANYFCKLLKYMDEKGYHVVVPASTELPTDESFVTLNSGYIQRASKILPKQGRKLPWRVYQNYFIDKFIMSYGKVNDGVLKFLK
jgi:monooxygenase